MERAIEVYVKPMEQGHLDDIVKIYLSSFKGMRSEDVVKRWFECNMRAYPRMQYFVALSEGRVVGYILWIEKGGFREESVWELEQIAVDPGFRGLGVGRRLIEDSISYLRIYLERRQPRSKLKLILVSSGSSNEIARRLYEKVLGAREEAVLRDFYRGDEVIYIARYHTDRSISDA
ncbi:MAG: GNAT family N-acetyltransferase [Nitrososphaerota archaeon]|nr:GNAT family N-acetyltransferase [Nitrososphaerota archaeon]